jgi:hypothetical protein
MPDPRRNEKSLAKLASFLKTPKTLKQIKAQFFLTERTAYRWMDYLREDGHTIIAQRMDRVTRFTLLGG